MSLFAHIQNNTVAAYPYTFAQLRRDNPQVSFPENPSAALLASYGMLPVVAVTRPASTLTSDFVEAPPVRVGNDWTQRWVEQAVSAEEAARRQQQATDDAQRGEIKLDTFVQNFIAMTPTQVMNLVDSGFPTLTAQERTRLGKLAVMLLLLARREFR